MTGSIPHLRWTATLLALAVAGSAQAVPPDCVPPPISKAIPFSAGEKLEMSLDVLGVNVGSLTLTVLPGRKPDALIVEGRGHTDSLASDFYAVQAVSQSHLGPNVTDRSYDEDETESGVRRTVSAEFPPHDGLLSVHATREGKAEDLKIMAPPEARDILAALFGMRAMALPEGPQLCIPVFGAHRLWFIRGTVAGHEVVHTPSGDYPCTHLSGVATRADNPSLSREVHVWLSDDAARLPIAAVGIMQGKPLRAQLIRHHPGIGQRKR